MNVCFIGHRKIENATEVKKQLFTTISELIQNGADRFLFGSRSDFNTICWQVVTELQKQYTHIVRINYTTAQETVFLSKEERKQAEHLMSAALHRKVCYADYDETVAASKKTKKANKNAYIMRNQEMLDASDICVFYYNKNYRPPLSKVSNRFLPNYQTQSGTAIAYNYAKRKKRLINLYEIIEQKNNVHLKGKPL